MTDQQRRVCITVLTAACALIGSAPAAGEVRVLRSDERSFVFEYSPVFSPPQAVSGGSGDMVSISFSGATPLYTDSTTGAPDLRYASFSLGFPAETGNAVQVIAADYEDVPNVFLAPVPGYRVREEMVEVDSYRVDPAAYRVSSFIPAVVASLSPIGASRSMLLGSVQVFPLQYNPATRTVRKYTRLVLEVVYGTPASNRVQNQDDLLFRHTLLNYNVARSWKFGRSSGLAKVAVPSVLASGQWYRITVAEEGVYALSAQYLASLGINTASIDPRTIKIYGNGGREVPENITASRAIDLVENAVYVEGETDGSFDASDFVLFHARGARGWTYNVATGVLNHYLNHYDEANYYWLTFGGTAGKRMQTQASLSDNPDVVPANFLDGVLVEEETVNILSSGKDWYGRSYNPGSSFTYMNTLPGLVPNDIIRYRYSLIARSTSGPLFTVSENNQVIGTHPMAALNRYDDDYTYATQGEYLATGPSSITNNTSQLKFVFGSLNSAGVGWNDWIEIQYPRRFEAVNNYLRFRSPNVTGVVEYRLEQFSAPFILNVTQFDDVRRVTGAVGSYTFRAAEIAGQISEYCAAGPGSFKLPVGITRMDNQDLRGIADGYQFIILTTPEFRAAADRLRDFRVQPAHGGLRTIVVDVNQIYNEFGGGIADVTAIRDFLKYAYDTWTTRPEFVLMFGQASYDYKGRFGRSSYVPTWQSLESRDGVGSYSTDDFFVRFGSLSARPSLIAGRLSARTTDEAGILVDKIIRYETSSSRDGWSMRTLNVADDRRAVGLESFFSAEHARSVVALTPDEFEKKQIYIAEYPTVNTAQGARKPGAYQAIIDEVNRGALIVNYAGHGNPAVWAHESILVVQTSIPQFANADKLGLFIAATCNFSQFDDLTRRTGSEVLMNKPDGGAIAAISATRKVFANANRYLHEGIMRQMFRRDSSSGRLILERPATALFLFKNSISPSENDQKFFFMGDPAMRLRYPDGYATIDSINGQPVTSTPVDIRALARVTVKGVVRDAQNQIDPSFNGVTALIVNDASQSVTYTEAGDPFTYTRSGGIVFRGQSSVRDGQFTSSFVVPKDIAYADTSTRGRVVSYFTSASTDGAGYTGNVRVGGTETAALDSAGPTMSIYLNSRSFRSGDMVSEDPVLYVDLVDSNGINTSVSGLGHRIEAWVNNSPQSRDLTDFYSSKLDNYQEGTVQFPLTGLPLGRNVLRVRAWDTHNNATTGEAVFDVASSQELRISDVMNYPNPFAGGTAFTFRQNQQSSLHVAVKIYTLAGRLIQSLETVASGDPMVRIPWNGRDRDGDVLANGVYLYKVIVKTTDGRLASEALGKLSVVK